MPPGKNWIDPYGTPVRLFGSGLPPRLRHYIYGIGVACSFLRHRRDFDVAYFLMGGFQLMMGLPGARLLGKSIVMKFSGSNTITPLTHSLLGRIELGFLRRWAKRILILNPAMVEEAQAAGFHESHLEWMPNPVDTEWFSPAPASRRMELRQSYGLDLEAPVILYTGRLAPEKELPSLIEAFALVVQKRPDARLVLLGGGPLQGALEKLIAELKLQNAIRLTGPMPPEAVGSWMQLSDIFTLVSSLEGLPCALLEAMSSALPAVVSDIPANRQLIEDEVHGVIVPCRNVTEIAAGLLRLIEDPDRGRRFGLAARQRIMERYSNEKVVALYEDLFRRLTGDMALHTV